MSIASEIIRLQQAKSDLATSITNKGVTVPVATTIDGYPALVDQIQTGETLPYDAEIEYLESTGTQYIDSGVNATTTLTTEIKFALVSGFSLGNTAFLFGMYNDSPSRYSVAVPSLSSLRVGASSGFTNVTCPTMSYSTAYTLSYKFGSIRFNGSQIGTDSGVINTTMTLYLFGRHNANTTSENAIGKIRIYKAKFTDNNNIVIRDLIPVRVGQTGCMYDKISKALFYNGGTGNFTLGPDVTIPDSGISIFDEMRDNMYVAVPNSSPFGDAYAFLFNFVYGKTYNVIVKCRHATTDSIGVYCYQGNANSPNVRFGTINTGEQVKSFTYTHNVATTYTRCGIWVAASGERNSDYSCAIYIKKVD